jgi:hypothetical protein
MNEEKGKLHLFVCFFLAHDHHFSYDSGWIFHAKIISTDFQIFEASAMNK